MFRWLMIDDKRGTTLGKWVRGERESALCLCLCLYLCLCLCLNCILSNELLPPAETRDPRYDDLCR